MGGSAKRRQDKNVCHIDQSGKVTLEDIARECGCSRAAVSFALNRNHPIGDELKDRIFAAVDKLGYRPYGSYGRSQKRLVAVLSGWDFDPYTQKLYYSELQRHGFVMQICPLPRLPLTSQDEEVFKQLQKDPLLVGVINLHPDLNSFDLLKRIPGVPTVISDRRGSMLSSCSVDVEQLGVLAADYMCKLGCRQAAYVLWDEDSMDRKKIVQGLKERTEGRILLHFIEQSREDSSPDALCAKLQETYQSGVRMFFVQNTILARTLLQWSYRQRLFIPQDLSVFTIDYLTDAANLTPPLTAITFPYEKNIRLTVETLVANIHRQPAPEQKLACYIVERASTRLVENK